MIRSGAICLSFLQNYLLTKIKNINTQSHDLDGNEDLSTKADVLICLKETFENF